MADSCSSTVSINNPKELHVLCIPYPIEAHINPMLKLAMTLNSLGFHITFVNTEFIHNHLLKSGALKAFANLPHFCFETFPGDLPPSLTTTAAAAHDYYYLLFQFAHEKLLPPLQNLIAMLKSCKSVSCVISDGLMPFNIRIARDLGVPGFLLWVPNACASMGYINEKGLMPPRAATSRRKEMNMEVVVTSRDNIKPSCPTPQHLRHLPLSYFDRTMYRVFIPMIFFYSKGSEKGDIIKATHLETSNHLKISLAETLAKFYPLAGRVKEYHTECNDQGVPFFEAQAKCRLSQVVGESYLAKLNKLLPYGEQAGDLALAIQINFFDCGGIAIGVCLSHKVVDGSSLSSFLNYWARIARGDHCGNLNLICPRFDLAKLFPPVENQISYSTTNCSSSVARRFVFSASALSAMRSKYPMQTSRSEALSAFIWTRFLAAGKGKDAGSESPLLVHHAVDLRTRMDPPLSEYHIGNLAGFARVGSSMDAGMEDDYVFIKKSRDAIRRVDHKFVKNLQNTEFAYRFLQIKTAEHQSSWYFSSLAQFPLYEADFGWGRPIWVTMSGLYTVNSLTFMPTRSGDGAEALLYLKEDDMAKLEADKEFLEFVSPPSGVKNQFLSSL